MGAGLLMLYPQGTTNTSYTSSGRVCVFVFVYGVYVGPGRRRAASDPGGHPCEWGRCGGGPSDVA